MCAWCRYTRGRFESTHGGFFCVPKPRPAPHHTTHTTHTTHTPTHTTHHTPHTTHNTQHTKHTTHTTPPDLVASYARAWSDTPCRQSFVPHTHTHTRTQHATTHNNTRRQTDRDRESGQRKRERRVKCDKHCELQESCFFYMSGLHPQNRSPCMTRGCAIVLFPTYPQTSDGARTHRGISYISVLFFELISNYIYIFGGLFELIM